VITFQTLLFDLDKGAKTVSNTSAQLSVSYLLVTFVNTRYFWNTNRLFYFLCS